MGVYCLCMVGNTQFNHCKPYNQSGTTLSLNCAASLVLVIIYLAADSVSRKVISEGTQAGEQRSTSNAASATSAGCMHLSWLNMPSVMGVATAAGWIATTLTLSNLIACSRHRMIRVAVSKMLHMALHATGVSHFSNAAHDTTNMGTTQIGETSNLPNMSISISPESCVWLHGTGCLRQVTVPAAYTCKPCNKVSEEDSAPHSN